MSATRPGKDYFYFEEEPGRDAPLQRLDRASVDPAYGGQAGRKKTG
jgi:hypothetical protein